MIFSIQYEYGQAHFATKQLLQITEPKISFRTVTGKIFSILL